MWYIFNVISFLPYWVRCASACWITTVSAFCTHTVFWVRPCTHKPVRACQACGESPGSSAFGWLQRGIARTTIVSCLRAWSRSAAPLILLSKRALRADQSAATLRGQEVTYRVSASVKCTVSPQILSTHQHLSSVSAGRVYHSPRSDVMFPLQSKL